MTQSLKQRTVPETLGSEVAQQACHVCLAGSGVSNNWSLIEPLKRRNQVTMIESLPMLYANSILATASVLVLDCEDETGAGLSALKLIKKLYPDLLVVLVNGTLSQAEIAEAFREGARDYFSHHSNAGLVVERVEHLCRQARREMNSAR